MPKAEGGLGLRRVKEFNNACLLKLGQQLLLIPSRHLGSEVGSVGI